MSRGRRYAVVEELDDNVTSDWKLLRRALLKKYDSEDGVQKPDPTIPMSAPVPPAAFDPTLPSLSEALDSPSFAIPSPLPSPHRLSGSSFGSVRKGVLRIKAENAAVDGYIGATKNRVGQFVKCKSRSEALFVTLNLVDSMHMLLVGSSESWLGLTWPNLKSTDWTKDNTYTACLATVSKSFLFNKAKTSSDVKGATNHKVWHVIGGEGEVIAMYPEDDGTPHVLELVVAPKDNDIRFVVSAKDHIEKKRTDRVKARIIFEPM